MKIRAQSTLKRVVAIAAARIVAEATPTNIDEMTSTFQRVRDPDNWKCPIDRKLVVNAPVEDEVGKIVAAVSHFIGEAPTVRMLKKNANSALIQVISRGRYMVAGC